MSGPKVIDVNKLALIKSTAEGLSKLSLDQVNLLLYEAGLPEMEYNAWVGDERGWEPGDADRRRFATAEIRDLTLTDITNLATAMHQLFDSDEPRFIATEPASLQLFASHLTKQKEFVHQVAAVLDRWRISMFVSHDDIEPDAEWHAEIEAGLQRADAGVIFLLPGIAESKWCDQETGWLLGRGVPVRALKFMGQDPYGPLGKQQALSIRADATARVVAEGILDWVENKPAIQSQAQASFVLALSESRSFDTTNAIWARIERVGGLTGQQVATVAASLRDNDQVYGGEYRQPGPNFKSWFPEVALRFLRTQPGYVLNEELIHEVAHARDIDTRILD